MTLQPGLWEEVAARGIDVVAPRIALPLEAAARRALPLGLGGQAHELANPSAQPATVGGGVGVADERDRVAAAFARRIAAAPDVRRRELA